MNWRLHFCDNKKPHNSTHLAGTYTEPYTIVDSGRGMALKIRHLWRARKHLKVRGGLGFSENGSRHHLNNGAGPPAPPRTRSQERGGPMPASLSIPSPALEGAPLPHFCKGPPPPVCSATVTVVAQRSGRNGRRSGLEENLSARPETGDPELPKVG